MRNRLVIIVTVMLVLVALTVLNAASYSGPQERPETELLPDRSTYNARPTGTRALYDLLSESGHRVMRWREPPLHLRSGGAEVSTFVIIGRTVAEIDKEDVQSLLQWVVEGGRLVIVDRSPKDDLLPRSGQWDISMDTRELPYMNPDPANSEQMTEGVAFVRPNQTSMFTHDVQEVRPSRFASVIRFSRTGTVVAPAKVVVEARGGGYGPAEPPPPRRAPTVPDKNETLITSPAPVVHLSDDDGPLLIDYPHGRGRIIVLSDPYLVSNSGIKLADNLQLALNTIAGDSGLIAFDEYHQGHASTHNALVAYFAGTPVVAIFGQLVLIILVIVWTRGRRFGRPLPLFEVDRRSSLEFVASMAELQQRARAFDLAIENIYSRTRRALQRYAGVDYHSSRADIAARVAARSSLDRVRLESLMKSCELTINGAPTSERQAIELVGRLRDVEGALGLHMRSRDVKQAGK